MKDFLRHLFLPHHSNDHRPKVLHPESLFFVIVFFLGLAFILPPIQRNYPSVLGIAFNISMQDLLSLTNQKRAEAGLPPLSLSPELNSAAAAKAQYMLAKNFWAHVAPDGTTPWYFIKNAGYEYAYAGENLARGFTTAPDVVNAWMASSSHRENVLSSNYKDVGFSVVEGSLTGSDTVLVVQEFGSRYASTEIPVTDTSPAAPTVSISPVPTQAIEPSPTIEPSRAPSIAEPTSRASIAAYVNAPLIDSKSTTRNLALAVLGIFITVLVVDLIVIERKKIERVVAHNLDHIIFLAILILAVIIIGGGIVL